MKKGHKYALTVIDPSSGFTIATPLLDKTADSFANAFLKSVVFVFGSAKLMILDDRSEIKNKTFQNAAEILGCHHDSSCLYDLKSNLLIETVHTFLK